MIPGMTGPLVSGYFAQQVLPHAFAGQLGETARDAAHRRFLGCWRDCSGVLALGPASSLRQVFDLAVEPMLLLLGYRVSGLRPGAGGRLLVGHLAADGSAAPALLVVSSWGENLDHAWRGAVRESVGIGADWCLCFNGTHVRLVDTRRSYARRFLEFDLEVVVAAPAAFALLWALLRSDAVVSGQEKPPLVEQIIRASARHAIAVCRSLKLGVLDSLGVLVSPIPLDQSLTIVYRILFLLFAESRQLLPTWHPVYRQSYSMEAARSMAESPGPARGLWEALQAMSRLAHAGCRSGDLRVTPFNGRLFSPAATPAGESVRLPDETARRLVLALSSTPGRKGGGRARIAYADLDVEQLGSVYESVLDYRPGDSIRRSTGTFYTPRSITTYLVRRALAPLAEGVSPDAILRLRIVDPAMGSGAFLVAACRYLARAYEAAMVEAGGVHPSEIGEAERRGFRRLIAQRCLYGVDINPMAVQLARLSLWLVTLAPDRPLTFLDHRLAAGNSLVGASVEDLLQRRPPGTSPRRGLRGERESLPLFGFDQMAPDLKSILPLRSEMTVSDDNLTVVRHKEQVLARLSGSSSPTARWRQLADVWCAHAFVDDRLPAAAANTFRAITDRVALGHRALSEAQEEAYLAPLREAASSRRFFHWGLEFPEVFYGEDGLPHESPGFDAVIGNPPWDVVRADNDEAAGSAARAAARAENNRLMRFVRDSGGYEALGGGHANSFQLFVERALRLTREGGRVGLVLPWGLAADQGCQPLRRALFDGTTVDALIGFENAGGIFPIHRSVRFMVLTTTKGGTSRSLRCRLGEREPAALDTIPSCGHADAAFPITLSRGLIERLSHGDLSLPDVRKPQEVGLLDKLYAAAPALGSPGGWGVEFGRELNATEDRVHLARSPEGLPVLEGKHISPFRVMRPSQPQRIREEVACRLLAPWHGFRRSRVAYRDVASATNRLTLIAAVLPAGCVTVHTLFCLRTPLSLRSQHLLCGLLNSLVVNYLVRVRVTTHVSAGVLGRVPVPRPPSQDPAGRRIAWLSRRLSRCETPDAHDDYAELQALVAHLYGLTLAEFDLILDTFPLIPGGIRQRCRMVFRA